MPLPGVLEYLWFRDNDPWWATLLRAVALIALAVLFVLKGMQKVPSGCQALRTRFNKVVHYRRDTYDRSGSKVHRCGEAKVVGPGLVIGIPFVHNIMIESVTEQFEALPEMIRRQPSREFVSKINFQVVDLEKALVGVTDYKGLLVNDCAEVVRRLVIETALRDDEISVRLMADDSLQQRASQLGVKLLKLTVSTSNPTDQSHSAQSRPTTMRSSSKALRPRYRRGPSTGQPAPAVNGASVPAALTVVDNNTPAA
jgi:regulator of protease activity HflC (stomatin/prohibitin superfamily)